MCATWTRSTISLCQRIPLTPPLEGSCSINWASFPGAARALSTTIFATPSSRWTESALLASRFIVCDRLRGRARHRIPLTPCFSPQNIRELRDRNHSPATAHGALLRQTISSHAARALAGSYSRLSHDSHLAG